MGTLRFSSVRRFGPTAAVFATTLLGCGEPAPSVQRTKIVGQEEPRAPLPIGVWQVRDVEDAASRLRAHWRAFPGHVQRDYEVSLRTQVIEFLPDGAARSRSDLASKLIGSWRRDGQSIFATLKRDPPPLDTHGGLSEPTPVEFRIKGGSLFVVSFDEEVELMRSTTIRHLEDG